MLGSVHNRSECIKEVFNKNGQISENYKKSINMLHFGYFGDPNTSHFIFQLLEGLSLIMIYRWKAKYLSNKCVNSFVHKIIYTIMLKYTKLSTIVKNITAIINRHLFH